MGGQYGYGANYPVFRGSRYQRGGAWYPVFPSSRRQRGAGLGGLFRGLFRTMAPHLKKGLTHLGKRALTAGANALTDMSENKTSLKDALKKQARSELKALNPINMMKGVASGSSPPKRKRKAVASSKKTKKIGSRKKKRKRTTSITL